MNLYLQELISIAGGKQIVADFGSSLGVMQRCYLALVQRMYQLRRARYLD